LLMRWSLNMDDILGCAGPRHIGRMERVGAPDPLAA
jgi:hypothetical protein